MTARRINWALLKKLERKLRRIRHEEHYNQGTWCEKTNCGTAACIAGHICIIKGLKLQTLYRNNTCAVGMPAATAIGICFDHWLFSGNPTDSWPEPFATRWANADKHNKDFSKRPSRIAADLIKAIINKEVSL